MVGVRSRTARNLEADEEESPARRPRPTGAGGKSPSASIQGLPVRRKQAIWVDYEDVGPLERWVNDRGQIRAHGQPLAALVDLGPHSLDSLQPPGAVYIVLLGVATNSLGQAVQARQLLCPNLFGV
jgi:hypothetical protein